MNPIAVAFAVAGLAVLAGAGVVAGFLREAPAPVEPLADPLEDRREALLRSLADLEDAQAGERVGEVRHRLSPARGQVLSPSPTAEHGGDQAHCSSASPTMTTSSR